VSLSLEARLEALEARQACTDLVHTYARLIRSDLPDEVADLFTPGGSFEVRNGHPDKPECTVMFRDEGREGIRAHILANKEKLHPVPLIHNLSITVDGEMASGNAVMEAHIYGSDAKVIGEYCDTFQRLDGKWHFAVRIYTVFRAASTI
jgi:SnoaL-like domain